MEILSSGKSDCLGEMKQSFFGTQPWVQVCVFCGHLHSGFPGCIEAGCPSGQETAPACSVRVLCSPLRHPASAGGWLRGPWRGLGSLTGNLVASACDWHHISTITRKNCLHGFNMDSNHFSDVSDPSLVESEDMFVSVIVLQRDF